MPVAGSSEGIEADGWEQRRRSGRPSVANSHRTRHRRQSHSRRRPPECRFVLSGACRRRIAEGFRTGMSGVVHAGKVPWTRCAFGRFVPGAISTAEPRWRWPWLLGIARNEKKKRCRALGPDELGHAACAIINHGFNECVVPRTDEL